MVIWKLIVGGLGYHILVEIECDKNQSLVKEYVPMYHTDPYKIMVLFRGGKL